ncbi:GGDEF domain-containing protein [Kineococcus rubinsiae]|uniref:GGDEF domain-containing protein n=1 Tax=Kineococcus rubinsiae TaxID=2609562 RepID=UPI0014301B10|nr:GGDEF domain-containing protein [Kineococcus rubinsiae]NIZ92864.1 GGDEF domain-containing protein [Kineococcus rubinsiae]
MRSRLPAPLRILLGLGGVLALLVPVVPAGAGRDAYAASLSVAFVVAMAVGVVRNRPRRPLAWWLLTAGVASWVAGDVLWDLYVWVWDVDPFPSPADALYLSAYVLLAAGCWQFVRARQGGRDREGLIDSAIFTVGFCLLSWTFLMRPTLAAVDDSVLARVLGAAYPLGDVLLLAFLVRLLTTTGGRSTAFRLLVAAAGTMLVADSAYQLVSLTADDGGGILTSLWTLSYLLFAAAALHPSMRGLTDHGPPAGWAFTRGRLAALTAASLLSPGTLVLQLALHLDLEAWAVALSSVVLFLLVVLRMSGLVHHLQEQAGQLAALARSDALTGLPNRRSSDAELERLRARAQRDGTPLSLVMLDLDRFKAFNDTFGHQAGDRLLVEASGAWQSALTVATAGADAVLARWGGEEFVVLLPGLDAAAAAAAVAALRPATPAGQTFSAGVAQWDHHEDTASLVRRADAALYRAKADGRDRVLLAGADGADEQGAGAERAGTPGVPAQPVG